MSSTDSTEIVKTDDSSLVSDLDKSLSDSISKKFSNVEIAYVKPDRIRVNVKKEEIIDVATFIRDELNFDHEVKNFRQVCPKEMLDKLPNPLTLKSKISKAV